MLKLNASYSKKVPADGEFTSQSYHASIEVELPDSLNQKELQKGGKPAERSGEGKGTGREGGKTKTDP